MAMNNNSSINSWNGKPYSQRYGDILEKRKTLPFWQQKEEFLKVLRENQTLILVGETGSGKTTQIPQFVLEAVEAENAGRPKKYMVGCTQPRRVAAMSVSRRFAEEMDVTIGEEVVLAELDQENVLDFILRKVAIMISSHRHTRKYCDQKFQMFCLDRVSCQF